MDLFRLHIVFTVNDSRRRLDYLRTHDSYNKKVNVYVLSFRGRPGESLVTTTLPEPDEELATSDPYV